MGGRSLDGVGGGGLGLLATMGTAKRTRSQDLLQMLLVPEIRVAGVKEFIKNIRYQVSVSAVPGDSLQKGTSWP